MATKAKRAAEKEFKFDPHALVYEELLYIYRGRNNALLVTVLSGLVLAGILLWGLGAMAAAGWYMLLLVASGWHWHIGRPNQATGTILTPLSEISMHIAAAGLAGLGWGCAAFAVPWLQPAAQAAVLV